MGNTCIAVLWCCSLRTVMKNVCREQRCFEFCMFSVKRKPLCGAITTITSVLGLRGTQNPAWNCRCSTQYLSKYSPWGDRRDMGTNIKASCRDKLLEINNQEIIEVFRFESKVERENQRTNKGKDDWSKGSWHWRQCIQVGKGEINMKKLSNLWLTVAREIHCQTNVVIKVWHEGNFICYNLKTPPNS